MITSLLPLAALILGPGEQDEAPPLVVARQALADHISLHVSDPNRSVEFYQDVIGLKEIPSPVASVRWLDAGRGLQLHLVPRRREAVADVRPTHLAFSVIGIDELLASLRSRNIGWWNFAGVAGAVT